MTTTTAQIRDLLLPGLNKVFGNYKTYPLMWKDVYGAPSKSDMAYERDVEMAMLPLAQLYGEGASIAYADMGERNVTTYQHLKLGLGFVITEDAIRDNLYKSQFMPNANALRRSIEQAQEIYAMAPFNNAIDPTVPGADGQPLLSASHPLDVGSYANTGTVAQELNETSLQDAIVLAQRQRDAAGIAINVRPRKLLVGPELEFTAIRLLGSDRRVGTADNDTNAIKDGHFIPEGYTTNIFLTNRKSWFLLTDADNGFRAFERYPLETDMFTDFDTANLKVKATWRGSWGYSNPRAVIGYSP